MKTFGEFVEMYERKLGARKREKKEKNKFTCDNCGVDVKSKEGLMRLGSSDLCADCSKVWHQLRDSED